MVPLPQNIFLQAEEAENSAHALLKQFAQDNTDPAAAEIGQQVLQRKFKLRTALRNSSDYKRDVADRSLPTDVVELVRLAQLPHYVWVTEVHDPGRCRTGTPCVVAEIVHDATSENTNARVDLFIVPGGATTFPPELPLSQLPPEVEQAEAEVAEAGDADVMAKELEIALAWDPPVVLSVPDHWQTSLPVCGMGPAAS